MVAPHRLKVNLRQDLIPVGDLLSVDGYNLIARFKTRIRRRTPFHHITHLRGLADYRPLEIVDSPEDDDSQQDIHDDPGRDNDHALPDRLRTEFPGLRRLFQVVGVEALIDHPRDLDVTANGDPRDAIIGLA